MQPSTAISISPTSSPFRSNLLTIERLISRLLKPMGRVRGIRHHYHQPPAERLVLIGYLRSYIIAPGTVYGLSSGKIAEIGVQYCHSVQIPFFIRNALVRGHVGIAEKGENVWPCVHISDRECENVFEIRFKKLTWIIPVAELYMVLYNSATNQPASTSHGREGFYYGENGEYRNADVVKAIATVLFGLGKVKEPYPIPFSSEENEKDPIVRWPMSSY